jgi:outer membrane protein TolC
MNSPLTHAIADLRVAEFRRQAARPRVVQSRAALRPPRSGLFSSIRLARGGKVSRLQPTT